MIWIAPTEKDSATETLKKRLWDSADQFRANSGHKAQEYSGGSPLGLLGIIFLRFAEVRFAAQRAKLASPSPLRGERAGVRGDPSTPRASRRGSRVDEPSACHAEGILYLTPNARFDFLLGEFARTGSSKGAEFYAPASIVRLMVEILEPYDGLVLDPACGSGGIVQSAQFVAEHKKNPTADLPIHSLEKTDETGRLCRINLAVHGLEDDIRHGGQVNSYYDDTHDANHPLPADRRGVGGADGRFDFVLTNPTFNVNAVDKERLKDSVGPDRRFPFPPRTLQDDLARLTFPTAEAHEALTGNIENLRRTHELLLPRLLSRHVELKTN